MWNTVFFSAAAVMAVMMVICLSEIDKTFSDRTRDVLYWVFAIDAITLMICIGVRM